MTFKGDIRDQTLDLNSWDGNSTFDNVYISGDLHYDFEDRDLTFKSLNVTGKTILNDDIDLSGNLNVNNDAKITGTATFNNIEITGKLTDGDGDTGTAGQILSTDGTDLEWINASSDRLHTNSVQNITGPGAISLTETVTFITTTGVNAYTLADGIEGQLKIIIMKVDGGDGTITPDNLVGWTSIRFNSVNDNVQLLYGSTGWNIIALQQAARII